jgi:hypothetical protein
MATNITMQDLANQYGDEEGILPDRFEADYLALTDAGLQLVEIRGNQLTLALPDVFPTEEAANDAYEALTGDPGFAPDDPDAHILDLRDAGFLFPPNGEQPLDGSN